MTIKKQKEETSRPKQVEIIMNEAPARKEPQRQTKIPTIPYEAHLMNLTGYIQTVTTAPSFTPKNFYDSIKIYIDDLDTPTDKRLYIYSFEAGIWNYVSLT